MSVWAAAEIPFEGCCRQMISGHVYSPFHFDGWLNSVGSKRPLQVFSTAAQQSFFQHTNQYSTWCQARVVLSKHFTCLDKLGGDRRFFLASPHHCVYGDTRTLLSTNALYISLFICSTVRPRTIAVSPALRRYVARSSA